MWGSDKPCRFPHDGSPPTSDNYFPGVWGFGFGLYTVAPQSSLLADDLDIRAASEEMESKLPGPVGNVSPERSIIRGHANTP